MDNPPSAPKPKSESDKSPEPHETLDERTASAPPESGQPTQALGPAVSPTPAVMPMMIPTGLPFPGVPNSMSGLAVQQVHVWQGQFPPPEAIERYNAVLPSAFDRIIGMAERQLDASIEGAAEARQYLREDSRRGHWLGWFVTVAAIGGAIFCATIHEPVVAGMLVAVPVMSVAKALIDSAKTRSSAPVAVGSPPPGPGQAKPGAPPQPSPQQDNTAG